MAGEMSFTRVLIANRARLPGASSAGAANWGWKA